MPPARLNFIGQSPGTNKLTSTHNRVVVIGWNDIGSNFAVGFNNVSGGHDAFFADQCKFYFKGRNSATDTRVLPNVNLLIQNCPFDDSATFNHCVSQDDRFAYDCAGFNNNPG